MEKTKRGIGGCRSRAYQLSTIALIVQQRRVSAQTTFLSFEPIPLPGADSAVTHVNVAPLPSPLPICFQLYDERVRRQLALDTGGALPTVVAQSAAASGDWTVAPLPAGLRDRKIDLGDVTPSDLNQLTAALNSTASGVQVTDYRCHSQVSFDFYLSGMEAQPSHLLNSSEMQLPYPL